MNSNIQNDTDEMAKKVSFGLNTKNINNRMADWYEEQNEFFEWINYYLSKLYWLVVIGAFVLIYMKFKSLIIYQYSYRWFLETIIFPFQLLHGVNHFVLCHCCLNFHSHSKQRKRKYTLVKIKNIKNLEKIHHCTYPTRPPEFWFFQVFHHY